MSSNQPPFYYPSYLDESNGTKDFQNLADSFTYFGDLRFKKVSSGYTAALADDEYVLQFDAAGTLYLPEDTDLGPNFPIGAQIAVLNYSTGRVDVKGVGSVRIGGEVRSAVSKWRIGLLVKVASNFWLLSLGQSGEAGPLPPDKPTLTKATAGMESVTLEWKAPTDDGGSPLTAYVVESSKDQQTWTTATSTSGTVLTATVSGLQYGVAWYFRVKAANAAGISDPSNVMSATPTEPFNAATGGTVTDVPNYNGTGQTWRVHRFTGNDTLTISKSTNPFKVLVVGGGGGGGTGYDFGPRPDPRFTDGGGGGGGGQVIVNDNASIPVGSYPVTVGGQASQSSVWAISAAGGASGGRRVGGSSGSGQPGGTQQLNPNHNGGGGGGGNASAGGNNEFPGGPGGNGTAVNITGSSVYYGGGSGGGGSWPNNTAGPAGLGGVPGNGVAGPANTGAGGGGGSWENNSPGGAGGSGVVVIAYRIA